jgi:hypothetical protein
VTGRTNLRRRLRSFEFATWLAIRSRGPVCRRWLAYPNFRRDVGPRPSWRHLLVRDDTSGAFEPGNAKWVVAKTYRSGRQPPASTAPKRSAGRRQAHA